MNYVIIGVVFALIGAVLYITYALFRDLIKAIRNADVGKACWFFFLLCILGLLFLALLCGFPCCAHPSLSRRAGCQSNLHQFDIALQSYCYPPKNYYPTYLNNLDTNDIVPELFVCPASGNEPGELTNAQEWTDYIYIQGLEPSTPAGIPIIICPYHYHNNSKNYLNILGTDHSVTLTTTNQTLNALLAGLQHRGYRYHVSDRTKRQLGLMPYQSAARQTLPVEIHRRSILVPSIAIVVTSFVLFLAGWQVARKGRRIVRIYCLATALFIGAVYLIFIRDSGFQLRFAGSANAVMHGKWLLPIAAFAVGLLVNRAKGIHGRRWIFLTTTLIAVCSLDFLMYVILPRPRTVEEKKEWLTYQSAGASCSAAACASLLRLHGLEVTEADAVRACLTTVRGTSWQGLSRGLSLLAGDDIRVTSRKYKCADDLPLPAVITVVAKTRGGKYREYCEKWGWDPGQPHTVVVKERDGDMLVVGDPAIGIERWNKAALDVLWNGEALRLEPPWK